MAEDEDAEVPKLPPDARLESLEQRLERLQQAEAKRTADYINAIHAQVKGRLRADAGIFPAGTPYDASDPRLLLWVHATLLDSLPLAYEQFAGPLTSSAKDEYCTEAREASALLGLPMSETTRHLRRLRSAGAVAFREEGKTAYYRLACPSWPRLVAKAIAEAEERGAGPGLRHAGGRRP